MRGTKVQHLIENQALAWDATVPLITALPVSGPYVFCGSGSSYYLAQTAASFALWLGIDAKAVPSTDIVLEPEIALRGTGSLIVISRSGSTTEALWASQQAQKMGWPVIGISCHEDSPLITNAPHAIISPQGEDDTIVMVKSFSSMLFAIQNALLLTAGQHLENPDQTHSVAQLIQQMKASLSSIFDQSLPRRLYILGSGIRYGIAQEGALKAQEMSNQCSMVYAPLEFRHGPWGSVQANDVVVILGQTRHRLLENELVGHLLQRTKNVIGIAQSEWFDPKLNLNAIVLPSHRSDNVLGPLAIVPLQHLAWQWTMMLGLDPDYPTNITQVVELHDSSFGQ